MDKNEKIKMLEEKIESLQAQKQKLKQQMSAEARKERTKRLIQIGAKVESICGCEITDMDAFEAYLQKYSRNIYNTQQRVDPVMEVEEEEVTENKEIEEYYSYIENNFMG